MTKEQIEKGKIYIEKLDILEDALNTVTNSVFDGAERKEQVSKYLHNNCLSSDCIALLNEEDCRKINQIIYDILIEKIKENQDILEKI